MTRQEELIKARAYALWQAEGCPHGREEEHWRQATLEIADAEQDTPSQSLTGGDEVAASNDVAPSEKAGKRPRAKPAVTRTLAKAAPREAAARPTGKGKARP